MGKELLLKTQAGDRQAYRQLIDLLYPFIKNYIAKRVGLNDHNDDITQEAIMGMHKNLATFHPDQKFFPWVSTIVRYKVVDHLRKVGRDQAKMSLSEFTEEIPQETSQGLEETAVNQAKIGEVLATLPECTKRAIILTKLEGRSMSETSQLIGISEVALRKRVSRAMKSIIRNFDNDG